MRAPIPRKLRSTGVTLIELAITIALVGILAALIVQFVAPVRSYIDTSRRAALADTADTALRRIGRDLRLALPNSVRVTSAGGVLYLEFLLVRTAGRYRFEAGSGTDCGGTTADDALVFGAADTCFTSIGGIPNRADVTASDYVVVFNLQPGTDKADAYQTSCAAACNKSQIVVPLPVAGTGGDVIKFSSNTFTHESPGRRFFIIEGPVTYACDKTGGTLTRYSGYGVAATQPTPPGVAGVLLASGVNDCSFTYDNVAGAANQGAGLVSLWLKLRMQGSTGSNEDVNLYHTVHVSNVP
jgi:MSHA biogenesis protein MshO